MTRTCGRWRRCLGTLLLALAIAAGDVAGETGEPLALLMFDSEYCEYCERFLHEVAGVYPLTPEGRQAPLKRRALGHGIPAHLVLSAPVRYTPTFVLLRGHRELGRITGYPGEAHFWGLLGVLLEKHAGS